MYKFKRFIRVYRDFIISGVLIFVALIGILVGLVPGVRRVVALTSETNIVAGEVRALTTKVATLESIDNDTLQHGFDILMSAVPSEKLLPSIISSLEALAARQEVSIINLSLKEPGAIATEAAIPKNAEAQKVGANMVTLSIEMSGTVDKLREILDTAVRVRRFFRVRSFDMSIAAKTEVTKARFTMDAFYIPLPKTLGKLLDPLPPITGEEQGVIEKVAAYPLLSQEALTPYDATIPTTPVTADPFTP